MSEMQKMNQANKIMLRVNDNDNDNVLSCGAMRGWRGTAPPFTQAGGVCVYIESAPHPECVNKTSALHPIVRQKALAPHPKNCNRAFV